MKNAESLLGVLCVFLIAGDGGIGLVISIQ